MNDRKSAMAHYLEKINNGDLLYTVSYWQRRPNTMAEIYVNGTDLTFVGFAKVNWPDKWDAQYGKQLALRKAVAEMVQLDFVR